MKLVVFVIAVLAASEGAEKPVQVDARCAAVRLPPGLCGPELPPCPPDVMLRDLEMLRLMDVLETWELLGE